MSKAKVKKYKVSNELMLGRKAQAEKTVVIDPLFEEKINLIYKLFAEQSPPPDTSDLPPEIATRINDLPLSDRRDILQNAADDLKRDRVTDGEKRSLMYWLNILRKNYFERTKTYLIPDKINTQAYLLSKLEEEIGVMCQKKTLGIMSGRIGWAFLDTNALKGTNDVFGHDKGNLVIRKIAKRLKGLTNIKLGHGVKIKLQCAIQSGDEYNLLIKSNEDLKDHTKDITQKVQDYIITTKSTGILDFSGRTVEDIEKIELELGNNGVNLKDKEQNNQFIISVSCGISTLEEVLKEIEVRSEDTFTVFFGKVKHYLELKAENRAIRGKKEIKEKVSQMNPLMKYLLSFRK